MKYLIFAILGSFFYTGASQVSKTAKIDGVIQSCMDSIPYSGVILVAENGEIIYEKGFGQASHEFEVPNNPNTVFNISSINKYVNALMVMKLTEENKISLNDSLSIFFPAAPPLINSITIHQLLSHSSGLPMYGDADKFIESNFANVKLQFEPGRKRGYSNPGYRLISIILEKVTGVSYPKLLQELVLDPAGMKNTSLDRKQIVLNRATGYMIKEGEEKIAWLTQLDPWAFGSGALLSTARDIYLLDRGLHEDKLITDSSENIMVINRYGNHVGLDFNINETLKDSVTAVYHGGRGYGFNAFFYRLLEDEHLIVLLTNQGDLNRDMLVSAILDVLYGLH